MKKLIGISNPSELTEPSTNKEVYVALQAAWKNIMENQLIVVEHREESIGDNNNVHIIGMNIYLNMYKIIQMKRYLWL